MGEIEIELEELRNEVKKLQAVVSLMLGERTVSWESCPPCFGGRLQDGGDCPFCLGVGSKAVLNG